MLSEGDHYLSGLIVTALEPQTHLRQELVLDCHTQVLTETEVQLWVQLNL
jgi:hypothetical protein